MQKLLVMNKYEMELLPGEAKKLQGGDQSYYQYLNNPLLRAQTGKNVQCVMWCLEGTPQGLRIEEPFGGVGVFAIAINNILKPFQHKVIELDKECYEQLKYCLRNCSNIELVNGDSHDHMSIKPSDVTIIDFPYFGIRRYKEGEWWKELNRTFDYINSKVVITDGCKFNFHFNWQRYQEKFDDRITADPKSYVRAMSRLFEQNFDYSITKCAYHNACFYYLLEPVCQREIEFKYFGQGTGTDGLKLIETGIEQFAT